MSEYNHFTGTNTFIGQYARIHRRCEHNSHADKHTYRHTVAGKWAVMRSKRQAICTKRGKRQHSTEHSAQRTSTQTAQTDVMETHDHTQSSQYARALSLSLHLFVFLSLTQCGWYPKWSKMRAHTTFEHQQRVECRRKFVVYFSIPFLFDGTYFFALERMEFARWHAQANIHLFILLNSAQMDSPSVIPFILTSISLARSLSLALFWFEFVSLVPTAVTIAPSLFSCSVYQCVWMCSILVGLPKSNSSETISMDLWEDTHSTSNPTQSNPFTDFLFSSDIEKYRSQHRESFLFRNDGFQSIWKIEWTIIWSIDRYGKSIQIPKLKQRLIEMVVVRLHRFVYDIRLN